LADECRALLNRNNAVADAREKLKIQSTTLIRRQVSLERRTADAVERFRDFQIRIQRLIDAKTAAIADPRIADLLSAYQEIHNQLTNLRFDYHPISPELRDRFLSLRFESRIERLKERPIKPQTAPLFGKVPERRRKFEKSQKPEPEECQNIVWQGFIRFWREWRNAVNASVHRNVWESPEAMNMNTRFREFMTEFGNHSDGGIIFSWDGRILIRYPDVQKWVGGRLVDLIDFMKVVGYQHSPPDELWLFQPFIELPREKRKPKDWCLFLPL
jgi:hypothetical protein